jgi:hypothetical protein
MFFAKSPIGTTRNHGRPKTRKGNKHEQHQNNQPNDSNIPDRGARQLGGSGSDTH